MTTPDLASDILYDNATSGSQGTEQLPGAREGQAVDAKQTAAPLANIPLPREGKWTPEALKALGVPDKPDGYQLQRPQLPAGMPYDESFEQEMRAAAHGLGLAPWQVQGMLDRYAGYAGRQFGDIGKLSEQARVSAESELQREWGNAYAAKLSHAKRTVATFGGESAVAELNQSGLGNNPALIRMLAAVGEAMGEDKLVLGDRTGGGVKRDPASVLYGR